MRDQCRQSSLEQRNDKGFIILLLIFSGLTTGLQTGRNRRQNSLWNFVALFLATFKWRQGSSKTDLGNPDKMKKSLDILPPSFLVPRLNKTLDKINSFFSFMFLFLKGSWLIAFPLITQTGRFVRQTISFLLSFSPSSPFEIK